MPYRDLASRKRILFVQHASGRNHFSRLPTFAAIPLLRNNYNGTLRARQGQSLSKVTSISREGWEPFNLTLAMRSNETGSSVLNSDKSGKRGALPPPHQISNFIENPKSPTTHLCPNDLSTVTSPRVSQISSLRFRSESNTDMAFPGLGLHAVAGLAPDWHSEFALASMRQFLIELCILESCICSVCRCTL